MNEVFILVFFPGQEEAFNSAESKFSGLIAAKSNFAHIRQYMSDGSGVCIGFIFEDSDIKTCFQSPEWTTFEDNQNLWAPYARATTKDHVFDFREPINPEMLIRLIDMFDKAMGATTAPMMIHSNNPTGQWKRQWQLTPVPSIPMPLP